MPTTSKQRFIAFRESSRKSAASSARRPSLAVITRRRARFAQCWQWLRPHRQTLLLLSALGLSSIAIDLVWPLASRYLIDHVILEPALPLPAKLRRLLLIAAGIAALFLANSLFDWVRSFRSQLLDSRFSTALERGCSGACCACRWPTSGSSRRAA
jgi:ABC-type bacteriocin/lantibiotic exporter with double-glycine peptidase domain